jgi:hypothetical protein
MQFFASSYYILPLGYKYSPQHPVLKHPRSMSFPQCERPSFTPIQNTWNNSFYIFIFTFLYSNVKTKLQNCILRTESALSFFVNTQLRVTTKKYESDGDEGQDLEQCIAVNLSFFMKCNDDDQWRYSPDRALASFTGFMIVCSTMWGYQLHDRPVLYTLIQSSKPSSSNYQRLSWWSRETRVRNGRWILPTSTYRARSHEM